MIGVGQTFLSVEQTDDEADRNVRPTQDRHPRFNLLPFDSDRPSAIVLERDATYKSAYRMSVILHND